MFSQYFTHGPIILEYESSFNIPSFQNSIYFEILLLINISFSLALNSSFPHIERNGTRFGTFAHNFGHLMPSYFYNHMVGPSLRLHKALVGDILY